VILVFVGVRMFVQMHKQVFVQMNEHFSYQEGYYTEFLIQKLFRMDKRDALVLLGIFVCGGTGVGLVVLLANGIIKNPFI